MQRSYIAFSFDHTMEEAMRPAFDKRTFHINREYSDLMKSIVPSRKQTEFVNRAIRHELEREQEKMEREQALRSLSELRKKRRSMPNRP